MKKELLKILIPMFLLVVLMAGCAKQIVLQVPVIWEDNEYFDVDGTWHAGIVKGLYSYSSGMPEEPFQYHEVTPGTNSIVEFTFNLSTYENYTMFIFVDNNGNQKYDAGIDDITDYTFATIGPGDIPVDLELNPYY